MASFLSKEGLDYFYQKLNSKFSTIATAVDLSSKIELKADKTAVKEQIANLVNSAPETLDTLNELAAALGDDPNFATTIATEIGKKVNSSEYNDAIAGINTSIASITPEKIGALNEEEYLGPVVLEGNPIVYESGTEGLGIAAVSYLEPKQEGSGDPYPAGGGKNIFPEWAESSYTMNGVTFTKQADGSIRAQGTPAAYAYITLTDYKTLRKHGFAEGVHTISGLPVESDAWFVDLIGDANTQNINFYQNGSFDLTDEIEGNGTYAWRIVITNKVSTVDLTFKPQVEKGSTATSYAPYSNIRPISGYNAVKLVRTGKNLFNGSSNKLVSNGITLEKDRGSEVTVYGSAAITLGMRVFETQLPAGTYTFSIGEIGNVNRFEPCINGTPIAQLWSGDTWTLTLETAADVGLNMIVSKDANCGTESNPTRVKIQLESGADATAYEPYQGTLHTIQIGQTVYGFRFDWSTGKGLIEWASYSLTSEKGVSLATSKGNELFYYDFDNMPSTIKGQGTLGFACSHYTVGNILWNDVTMRNKVINTHDNKFQPGFAFALGTYGSVDAWNDFVDAQYAAGTPIQLVWPLANPIEIQLTPTQISELEGINTIYGNGSNIRAIFNTTGGASPVLESISGILPVEKGGTGSTSAAGARNNLGITPQNIGALPTTGGDVTGRLVVNGGENYVDLSVIRKINGSEHTACLLPNSTTGCTELFYIKDGTTICNYLSLKETYTAFMKPVDIASGGTGATDAATARANLGITPANIGALSTGGGALSGSLTLDSGSNFVWLEIKRTVSSIPRSVQCYIADEGNCNFIYTKNNEVKNGMFLFEDRTAFIKPLEIASGGTGANNRHGALTNLCALGTYYRGDMGDSPNFDDPGINGLFEVRSISETPNATGIRPFDGFGPLLSFKTPDNIAMLQLAAEVGMGLRFRTKQAGNVTLSGVNWKILLDDANYTAYTVTKDGIGASGTWGISVTGSSASCTGNAATATTLQTTRSINGTNFNGSANITTANWGTARTISISSTAGTTGTSINGSANASLVIPTTLTGFSSISSTSFSASSGKYYGRAGNLPLLVPAAGDFYFQSVDSSNTSGDSNFRKGAIKFLCNKNANFDGVVVGRYHPNSHGILVGDIYDSSTIDSTTGLPQYSTFWGSNLAGSILIFGTENYNYYERGVLDSSNYTGYTVKKDGTGASGTWGISISGNAATATSLSGTLAVNKGGTGITSNPSMLVNLGSTSAASVFAASPRPGITGTLAIGNGGTGATTQSGARTNLGICGAITHGTGDPSGGSDGDIYFKHA